jgi:hypothetical protein
MFVCYASNHEGDCYRMWNPKTKKVSETCDVVFLNRMVFRTPTMPVNKKQDAGDDYLDSVQKDERGGTVTMDFVTGDNDAATVESAVSSVLDTPMVKGNQDSPSMDTRTGAQCTLTLQQVVQLVQKQQC